MSSPRTPGQSPSSGFHQHPCHIVSVTPSSRLSQVDDTRLPAWRRKIGGIDPRWNVACLFLLRPFTTRLTLFKNHVNTFKGRPRRFALSELVPHWYKSFPSDHFFEAGMDLSTMMSNKTGAALCCAGDPILETLILRNRLYVFVRTDK